MILKNIIFGMVINTVVGIFPACGCGLEKNYSVFFNQGFSYRDAPGAEFMVDVPFEKFLQGYVGVVKPYVGLLDLWVFYRYITQNSLTILEQQQTNRLKKRLLIYQIYNQSFINQDPAENKIDYYEKWKELTAKILAQKEENISIYKTVILEKNNQNIHFPYENCSEDGFRFATDILNKKISQFGIDAIAVKEWTIRQRDVFKNCASQDLVLPNFSSQSSNLEDQYDQEYQYASSLFYGQKFEKAASLFEKLSEQKSSYQALATYLVLRSHFRNFIYGKGTAENFYQAFERLKEKLRQGPYWKEAHYHYNKVQLEKDPQAYLKNLSQRLMMSSSVTRKQDIKDLIHLYKTKEKFFQGHDFLDWIIAYRGKESFENCYQKWQANSTLPWLIVVLSKLASQNRLPKDLLQAANAIERSSPAFLTIRESMIHYYLKTDPAQARRLLNDILTHHALELAEKNRFLTLKSYVTQNIAEHLTTILQYPVLKTSGENQDLTMPDLNRPETLNQVALEVLKEILQENSLPSWLKIQLTSVGFTRSIFLHRLDQADLFLKNLTDFYPDLKADQELFSQERQQDRKYMLGLLLIARYPGLRLVIYPFNWRDTLPKDLKTLDTKTGFRENWWYSQDVEDSYLPQPFLTPAQQELSKNQWKIFEKLKKEGVVNHFCQQTLNWFHKNPQDPIIPEMMHLCVRLSRYFQEPAPKSSLIIFQQLHRNFKGNPFQQKTPFHYYSAP